MSRVDGLVGVLKHWRCVLRRYHVVYYPYPERATEIACDDCGRLALHTQAPYRRPFVYTRHGDVRTVFVAELTGAARERAHAAIARRVFRADGRAVGALKPTMPAAGSI